MKKSVVAILSMIMGVSIGAGAERNFEAKKIKRQNELANKHLNLYLLMNQWVRVKQENKSIANYLARNGYKEIAVYGMHYVGETFLSEISGTEIKVMYGIDKNAASIFSDVEVVSPDDELQQVDAVIVTAITYFEEIVDQLSTKINCPIISIEDILYDL